MTPKVIKVTHQTTLAPTSEYPYAKFPFTTFNPVQSRVIESYDQPGNYIVAASTSAGKAQPDDAIVLTVNGYRKICDIQVGDSVIGPNGRPTEVIGVFPQGEQDVYKVKFSDDTSTECTLEHLWNVRTRHDRCRNSQWKTLRLSEIMEKFKPDFWHIPVCESVEFPTRDFVIHPYVLGLLLGDGGIAYQPKITCADSEILERFVSLLPEGTSISFENKYDYRIIGDGVFNRVAYELDVMSLLGKRSHQKFIPHLYLHSSSQQRINLLQGLMDSDGGLCNNRSPTFEITSKQLAEDVSFLVRSLGGWTRIKKNVFYRYKGEKGKDVYRLTIGLPFNPFGVGGKRNRYSRTHSNHLRKIRNISKIGRKPCRCIKVKNEDGLYLTNDFIVTHNTVCAEMFLAHEVREKKDKGMYLAPLKALAQEKIDDWTDADHHFNDLKVAICTGDYRITAARKKEIDNSNLIIMSSEMLNSRCRNFKSENNEFLAQIGTLVVDESHLLTVPGRGDHLESGIMKFTQINPEGRLVFLSATMPNVTEIGQWMSWLTRRDTVVLESNYRPCPLHVHYEKYYDVNFGYEENERSKIRTAIEIMQKHPKDKFLLFVHTKRTGDMLANRLKELGIQCEYHNADLTKDKRIKIEKRFKEDPKLRCIVATSTLAWGTNLPARRVIVLGVHRGMSDVATYDIAQMIGRAGRPQYDPQGDAYILLPGRSFHKHKERLESPQLIQSQISDAKCLAFHLTSEIHHNTVKSTDDIQEWYERSLAFHQDNTLNQEAVEQAVKRLTTCGAITEKNKNFDVTSIGTVASMFYYSPFDISDLARNFGKVFERRKEDSDYWVAMALGNIDSLKFTNASNADKEDMAKFKKGVEDIGCERVFCGSREFTDGALKAGCCYYNLLKGYNSIALGATMRGMQADAERLCEVLCAIDQMVGKWDQKEYFRRLYLRILYGVEEEMVSLCCLKGVGKIKAKRLWDANLRTWEDISTNALGVIKALSCSKNVAEQICENAKELIARESTK